MVSSHPRPVPAPVPGSRADQHQPVHIPKNGVSVAEVWKRLSTVPDPEIPVISVTDLGIVRAVALEGTQVAVTITPTYSGCPATNVIGAEITAALTGLGLDVTLHEQLSPPWTTQWLSDTAKAKLEAYGIAPPRSSAGPDRCPRCHSDRLEKVSQYGSTPCKAQWRCTECLEPFDYFKCL